MRRGVLYKKVEELGFNKLALGHHFDDIVETTMINMFFCRYSKNNVTKKFPSTSGKMDIIRPLAYVREKDIINFMKYNDIQAMSCGCPIESGKVDSKRKEIKFLLQEIRN